MGTTKFNQTKYINEWQKEHLRIVKGKYDKDYVAKFKKACRKLNKSQSSVIRNAMDEAIKEAGK